MRKIIIYGSKYGTTERYATELSRRTGINAYRYNALKDLSEYDVIIYLGGLYAGGVLGLSSTVKLMPAKQMQRLLIITVGLADPKDKTNTDSIKYSIEKQVPKHIYDRAEIFHLRGGIDYQTLNLKHKAMMKLMYIKDIKTPPEKQTKDTKEFIETYNKKIDFVDFDSLNRIMERLS
jgi:flavodoxin